MDYPEDINGVTAEEERIQTIMDSFVDSISNLDISESHEVLDCVAPQRDERLVASAQPAEETPVTQAILPQEDNSGETVGAGGRPTPAARRTDEGVTFKLDDEQGGEKDGKSYRQRREERRKALDKFTEAEAERLDFLSKSASLRPETYPEPKKIGEPGYPAYARKIVATQTVYLQDLSQALEKYKSSSWYDFTKKGIVKASSRINRYLIFAITQHKNLLRCKLTPLKIGKEETCKEEPKTIPNGLANTFQGTITDLQERLGSVAQRRLENNKQFPRFINHKAYQTITLLFKDIDHYSKIVKNYNSILQLMWEAKRGNYVGARGEPYYYTQDQLDVFEALAFFVEKTVDLAYHAKDLLEDTKPPTEEPPTIAWDEHFQQREAERGVKKENKKNIYPNLPTTFEVDAAIEMNDPQDEDAILVRDDLKLAQEATWLENPEPKIDSRHQFDPVYLFQHVYCEEILSNSNTYRAHNFSIPEMPADFYHQEEEETLPYQQ